MLSFGDSFLALLGATAVPAFIGLLLVTGLARWVKAKYLVGFALGIFFWFFVDTINGSADLYVNAGFEGGASQLAAVLLFVVGLLVFFSVDRGIFSSETGNPEKGLVLALLAAVAVGIHGLGEGSAFGSTAALTSSTSLFETFGGLAAVTAYVLHKLFEPMMVGAIYVAYAKRSTVGTAWLRDVLVLTLIFSLPSLIGAATGYYIGYDATYFFALGASASLYVAFRLTRTLFGAAETDARYESLKVSIALIIGFIFIYIAALFHS